MNLLQCERKIYAKYRNGIEKKLLMMQKDPTKAAELRVESSLCHVVSQAIKIRKKKISLSQNMYDHSKH